MTKATITATGRLQEKFLPAMYFDSSVLIAYWMTEGLEMPENNSDRLFEKNKSYLQVVRDILKSEKTIRKVVEIRKRLLFEKTKVVPIVSPLSLLELAEWHSEAAFKQISSEAAGTVFIQRMSRKQIGDYLRKTWEMWRAEKEEKEKEQKKQIGIGSSETTDLQLLMSETWINSSFAVAHGLSGLWTVDIANFSLKFEKVWLEPTLYAHLQLGMGDIMHILLAKHLGCQYIASFDADFRRVKDRIFEKYEMSVLSSPEEILAVL